MWLITSFGFFSVVEKPGDRQKGLLTVRARVREDLEALKERYLPTLGPIASSSATDYRYRAVAPKPDVAAAAAKAVFDIDYDNFKNRVKNQQGATRAHVYADVWSALYSLQSAATLAMPLPAARGAPEEKATSFGGVVIDADGRVLLREPRGHFDGYVWTFPKGKRDPGSSPEETALREVREEAGYDAEIVGVVPGLFKGGTGSTRYFLMKPKGAPSAFDAETQQIRWVTFDEAAGLIRQTRNSVGRERDLKVLEAARQAQKKISTD